MQFQKQNPNNYLLHDTLVENLFISDYAKKAPGDYVKVYLLALMYANIDEATDTKSIAKALELSVSRVEDAWEYWKDQGIVNLTKKGDELCVEFLSIKDQAFAGGSGLQKIDKSMERTLDDKSLSMVFSKVSEVTGRLLESMEPEAIASWIKNFEINPEVIIFGYKYCTDGKSSNRYKYVEKVLKDWKQKGLDTVDEIKEYLGETNKRYDLYKKVLNELGFHRAPSVPEKEFMDRWIDEYKLSLDEILMACKKTTGIANPNFNYLNSVLLSYVGERDKNEKKLPSSDALSTREAFYEKTRKDNLLKTAKIRDKVFEDIPRLRDIMDELRSCGYKISRAMLAGASGKQTLAEEKENQRKLLEEKKRLLAENGYQDTALDQIYSCKLCRDTGLRDDGTVCDCFSKACL